MKLNNKGYLLVEIIVASVLAMVLAYFLIDLTVKLKERNDDAYVDTILSVDKALITKEVMNDINEHRLVSVTNVSSSHVTFTYEDLEVKELNITNNTIKYGDYSKKLDDKLSIGNIDVSCKNNDCSAEDGILYINIPAKTNYSDIDYGINLVIPYSKKIEVELPKNLDDSGANIPKLSSGMIPVYYDEISSNWKKADSQNSDENYKWYEYNAKMWANIVLVSDTNRSKYEQATNGTTITDSDILAYYVWIPRYKYKVWNIERSTDESIALSYYNGIDIQFEKGTATTGTITCNYNFSSGETCTGENGQYYTHPAFWWDTNGNGIRVGETGEELTGFWMGKFEVSGSVDSIMVRPLGFSANVTSIAQTYYGVKDMQKSGNIYGLPTDINKIDSHMTKNIEWGAVVYITQSKYGLCNDSICEYVRTNGAVFMNYYSAFAYNPYRWTSSDYPAKTGYGPYSNSNMLYLRRDVQYYNGSKSYYYNNGHSIDNLEGNAKDKFAKVEYTGEYGKLSSTTLNVYGIYDMAGARYELVMASTSNSYGSFGTTIPYLKYDNGYAFFNGSKEATDQLIVDLGKAENNKYIDKYTYNKSSYLGDAIGETGKTITSNWFTRGSWFRNIYDGRYSCDKYRCYGCTSSTCNESEFNIAVQQFEASLSDPTSTNYKAIVDTYKKATTEVGKYSGDYVSSGNSEYVKYGFRTSLS